MFVNNEIKKQLEKLSNQEENKKCFDCGNIPARWTSLNNGIYLCHECSEEHKNFESGLNKIKSINLEQWNKSQLNIMKIGGNKRLKTFLENNNVPKNIDKKTLYNSKIMIYYRKQLKAEAEGELLLEQLPPKEEFWEMYQENNDDSNNNLNLNQINDFNTGSNDNLVYYDNDENNQFVNGHLVDYPKSSISINEDQYSLAKEKKVLENKLQNSVLKKDSLLSDSEEPKFSSVGSENESFSNNSIFQNSGYIETIGSIVSTVWETGASTASSIKEKINEYQIGKNILYIGGKVFEGVIYIGQNLVHKAGQGLVYIAHKIAGKSGDRNNSENASNNYIGIGDEIMDKNDNNFNTGDYENNYGILNEKKENLLV